MYNLFATLFKFSLVILPNKKNRSYPFIFWIHSTMRSDHGTYNRWYLRYRCTRKEKSLRYDLFKAFDYIKISHKSDFFSPKRHIFLNTCATCSELPFNISTMRWDSYNIDKSAISTSNLELWQNCFVRTDILYVKEVFWDIKFNIK